MTEFTYTTYTDELTNRTFIIRSDGWQIPTDESNSDYQAYLASLENPTAKK